MKNQGIKYLAFDKDNTLTKHLGTDFYNPEMKNFFDTNVRKFYKKSEIAIVSNLYPKKKPASEILSKKLDIDVFYTGLKPKNFKLVK